MSIDKAALFAERLPQRDVPIGDLGTVRVRGLSRFESLKIRDVPEGQREAHIIAMGIVDPPMTLDEVHRWQAAAPGGGSRSPTPLANCLDSWSPARRTPTKAMEANPDLEFEHFLAAKLGMTVARLRDEMGSDEFVRWGIYYARIAQREELAAKTGGA